MLLGVIYTYLDGVELQLARLKGATLISATLKEADLSGTNLSGVDLTGCFAHEVSAWSRTPGGN